MNYVPSQSTSPDRKEIIMRQVKPQTRPRKSRAPNTHTHRTHQPEPLKREFLTKDPNVMPTGVSEFWLNSNEPKFPQISLPEGSRIEKNWNQLSNDCGCPPRHLQRKNGKMRIRPLSVRCALPGVHDSIMPSGGNKTSRSASACATLVCATILYSPLLEPLMVTEV